MEDNVIVSYIGFRELGNGNLFMLYYVSLIIVLGHFVASGIQDYQIYRKKPEIIDISRFKIYFLKYVIPIASIYVLEYHTKYQFIQSKDYLNIVANDYLVVPYILSFFILEFTKAIFILLLARDVLGLIKTIRISKTPNYLRKYIKKTIDLGILGDNIGLSVRDWILLVELYDLSKNEYSTTKMIPRLEFIEYLNRYYGEDSWKSIDVLFRKLRDRGLVFSNRGFQTENQKPIAVWALSEEGKNTYKSLKTIYTNLNHFS